MKRIILAILVCCMSFASVLAQRTVKGTVTDETKTAIAGVAVIVKGTKIGTVTDEQGKFQLQAEVGDILSFQMFGMTDVEKVIVKKDSKKMHIVLYDVFTNTDKKLLVFDKFGSKIIEKKHFVNSDLHSKELFKKLKPKTYLYVIQEGNSNKTGFLTKTADGVIIKLQKRKETSKGNRIVIKGKNASILIVIDGKIQDKNYNLKELSPDTIKEITVLKGEAATAVYGEKGENGVILITTKR